MIRSTFSRIGRRVAIGLVALTLSGTAATAAGTSVFGRIFPGQRNVHSIYVGSYDNFVVVRGSGTDIDCWLYDSDGDLVSSDTDDTSICVLPAPGVGVHRVSIRNLGQRSTYYTVRAEN
jgi:hypothetical protein